MVAGTFKQIFSPQMKIKMSARAEESDPKWSVKIYLRFSLVLGVNRQLCQPDIERVRMAPMH